MRWYSSKYRHNGQPPRRDNKNYYSSGCGASLIPETTDRWYDSSAIRVPSLKRSKSIWKRFYRLFPELKYRDSFLGHPLKNLQNS